MKNKECAHLLAQLVVNVMRSLSETLLRWRGILLCLPICTSGLADEISAQYNRHACFIQRQDQVVREMRAFLMDEPQASGESETFELRVASKGV
jgi:hypothetical protein